MSTSCETCHRACDKSSEKFFQCDSCERYLHIECAKLTTTEVRVLELKSERQLHFYCSVCRSSLRLLPQLMTDIYNINALVSDLTERIVKLEKRDNDSENKAPQLDESLISEVSERFKRKNNIMIYNLEESDLSDDAKRLKADEKKIQDLLNSLIKFDTNSIKQFSRLGKAVKDKVRPIKVTLTESDIATSILRNKDKCPDPVKIASDQTTMQRDYLRKLRNELDTINKDAVTKTIKFVRGIPTIVELEENVQVPAKPSNEASAKRTATSKSNRNSKN